jgi:tRNA (cmo5U34)-methyltransferase
LGTLRINSSVRERFRQYAEKGPPAFTPGHAGLMQMIVILVAERMPSDGTVLVIGAGGGLETRYLAAVESHWRGIGIDSTAAMLDLARATAGKVAGDRLTLIGNRN